MTSLRVSIALLFLAASYPGASAGGYYGPGASDTEIILGQTMAYSGPASAFGQIGHAMSGYFDKVNADGGINGRKVRLFSLDDGYQPAKALEQIRKLVEHHGILASAGNLGTQSNLAMYRYLNERHVPHLFIISGMTRWNDPRVAPWTIGFLPTYYTEGRIYAAYVLREVPQARIAILYQKDDAGREGIRGFREGLGDKARSMIVAETTYEVSDPTVDSQIANLAASGANVFVNGSAPRPAAQAIRKMRDVRWHPLHILFSPGANIATTFRTAGVESSTGIVSAGYLKDPGDPQWTSDSGTLAWRAWMAAYLANGRGDDPFNVLGYSVAELVVHVLRQCGDDLRRENLLRQALHLRGVRLGMLLPGIVINTSPEDRRVIRSMQMQRFNGSRWELLGHLVTDGDGDAPR
jgi:ABC-type branched-subunit amino acid transport system substrate-binding protein